MLEEAAEHQHNIFTVNFKVNYDALLQRGDFTLKRAENDLGTVYKPDGGSLVCMALLDFA